MKRLHITMAYTFVGDTGIDVPDEMTLEEAAEYAREHIDEISIADNAEYVAIAWDTDKDDCADLPTEVANDFYYDGDKEVLTDSISDWLSDEYGYCHCGFQYEIKS